MKNYFNYFRFLLVAIMLASASQLYADKTTETEGTSFWFAIPTARIAIGEATRGSTTGSAEEVYITSKVDATVNIYSATNNFVTPYKTIQVKANSMKIVPLLKHTQDTVGENVAKKAYYVKSDQPVSLVVYISWNWTGEAFRIVPEDWLGTEYYTLNLYNDWVNMYDHPSPPGGSFRDHPGQILIVATEDNTQVTYTPTTDTRLVKVGASKTITMNKGETYLIFSKIDPFKRQWESTDLSGTRIQANKKIAVYSGHTKGVFPKYNPSYYHGLKADFARNMLFDSMWPIELLGKEYVTVPNMYSNQWNEREYQGKHENERGDLVRFVATRDNTIIWEVNASGEEVPLWTRLKRGEYRDLQNQETPGHFRSNYPVLVGQYGKGWFWWSGNIVYKEGEESDKEDELQNPSRCGQGMLYCVTPVEQWSNYAGFISVVNVNNHVTIVFKTGDEEKIVYREGDKTNTETLKQKFSSGIKKIGSSGYSYVRTKVSEGNNSVESIDPSAKFAVYAYGNQDAYKDGFAYGYPTNVNYFTPCEDTIIVNTTSQCEIINGTVAINDLIGDEPCAAIQNIRVDPVTVVNATLTRSFKTGDKNGTFVIKFNDKTKDGYIKITVLSKSGNTLTKEFTYSPELVAADKALITFNKMQVNVPGEQTIIVSNPSEKVELNIKKLYLKNAINAFTIIEPAQTTDIVIPPLGSITVKVRALLDRETSVTDDLYADLACYTQKLTTIKANSGTPIITIQDVPFGTVSLSMNPPSSITKVFKNEGTVSASITGYRMKKDLPGIFTMECPELLAATAEAPLEIEPGASVNFKVTYTPDVANVDHKATLELISSNATVKDFESDWTGRAVDAAISITSWDWGTVRVIDEWSTNNDKVTKYTNTVTVKNEGSEKINIFDVKRIKGTYDDGVTNENAFYTNTELPELTLDATAVADLKTNGLEAGASKEITVTFIPTEQLKYFCGLKVTGEIASTKTPKESPLGSLKGIGKQPHVATYDVDFGRLNLNQETSKAMWVPVYATSLTDAAHDMELSVVGLRIGSNGDATHAGMYQIDDTQFTAPSVNNPTVLKIGDTLMVPVIFTPPSMPTEVDYKAQLDITCDAPNSAQDDKIAVLTGRAYKSNVATTGHNFTVTYMKMLSTEKGTVTFKNNGTVPVYITNSIFNSLKDLTPGSGHTAMFQLTDENYIDSDPTKTIPQMEGNIEVPAGATYVANILFRPDTVMDYKAIMEFTYAEEDPTNPTATDTAVITGSGKQYLADCSIPKGYEAAPGEYISYKPHANSVIDYAEFRLKPRSGENKSLSDAGITKFTAEFKFADEVLDLAKGLKHVYPLLNSEGKVDIVTDNTMTSGWTAIVEPITDMKTLKVTFKNENGGVLTSSNDDVLFKFRMLGYLSQAEEKVPLKPTFTPLPPFNQYFFTDRYDGDVTIKKVCIDSARIITTMGLQSKTNGVAPMPVVNSSVLDYTVAINCPVLIEVFNSNGAKVATLVNNEMKKPGNYKLDINPEVLGLPNGTYTYRIDMGGYSESKSFVIKR